MGASLADRLNRPHSAVSTLRSEKHLAISKAAHGRALLLAQGLSTEAERRGYGVTAGSKGHHLVIRVNGYSYGIKIREQDDRIPHQPTTYELRQKERYSWTRIAEFDPIPSGRLTFELDEAWNGRQYRWADGKRLRVEDRLADLLVEIEMRATEDEQKRIERDREQRERQARWERAIKVARERYTEHARSVALHEQLDHWELAARLRQFCNALDALVTDTEASDEPSHYEWSVWARSYAESIDPLRAPPAMPVIPEPKNEDLEPFLDGWSPHGPEASWWK
jgi:hypothetical protein